MAPSNDAPDPFSPGAIVGHFRIVRELGRGGFGVVHLAEDQDIPGRVVALKTIHAGRGTPAAALRHEAAALAALQHPNILVVHEVGEAAEGVVYLAAEYMAGGALADRLRAGPVATSDAIAIARAAADALAAAHDRAIVHRDFKPANLLFTEDGTVKVADFGIAVRGSSVATTADPAPVPVPARADDATITIALDHGRGIAGTPMYLPPELFAGGTATALGDQFSFGVTVHETLTGKNPFDPRGGVRGTLGVPAISPGIPRDLRKIVARCLARDPARRHPDMRAVVAALDAARARRSRERRRTLRVAAAFAATLVLLLASWMGWRVVRERRARALNEAGSAALQRGDRDAARAALVAAHAADPNHLPACANLGSLAALDATPAWAVTILRDCATRFPASDVVRYNLGSALRATGAAGDAERELRIALELAGSGLLRASAINELALVLIELGKPADAIELLQAQDLDARGSVDGAVLTKTLGLALLAAGKPEDAVLRLRAALDGALPARFRAETLLVQALAFERSGRPGDAAEVFARVIAEGGEGDVATRAREGLGRVQPALQ